MNLLFYDGRDVHDMARPIHDDSKEVMKVGTPVIEFSFLLRVKGWLSSPSSVASGIKQMENIRSIK